MKFSLRAVFVTITLIGLSIGWYMMWRRANVGVKMGVHRPLVVDDFEVPESMREFSYGAKVRAHDQEFPWPMDERRIREVRNNLSAFRINGSLDRRLLQSKNSELRELARSTLDDESSSFMSAANAAWILDQTGDPTSYAAIVSRHKKRLDRDDGERWKLSDVFPVERLLTDPAIVAEMKSRVGEDSDFGLRSQRDLFKAGIARQPLITHFQQAAEQQPDDKHSIKWLIKNAPSVRALELAQVVLASVSQSSNNHLAQTVLMTDFSHSSELQEAADRVERKLIEITRADRKTDRTVTASVSFAWQFWDSLVYCGSHISKDLFVETLNNPQLSRYHFSARKGLIRLDHGVDCQANLRKTVFDTAGRSRWEQSNILHQYEQACGREETILTCLKLISTDDAVPALRKLTDLFEDTNDEKTTQLILEKMFCRGEGKDAVEALQLLERIGCSNLSDLWARLPVSKTADPLVRFYQYWHTQNLTRGDLIKWINKNLQPSTPVSALSVLDKSKFSWDSNVYGLSRFLHAGFTTRHQFAMAALANSGSGNLAFGEDIYLEEVPGWISQVATTESGDFHVTSHSTSEMNGRRTFKLVINQRLYQFTLRDAVERWENKYDARAIVELLNAIAIRQRMKRRFFAYPTEWDDRFCLVMFITPAIASELENKFGLSPVEGSKYYLTH